MQEDSSQTSIISVRVPDFIKKELQQESETSHITLNAMIAKILIQYIEWNQFVQESGFVYTNRTFLKQLFEITDIKEIEKIAEKYCAPSLKTSITYIHGDFNNNTFIKTLESWLRTSHIPYRRIEKNESVRHVIQHGLGIKWSRYLLVVIKIISNDLGYSVDANIEDNTLSFSMNKTV
ncbi:MAG: hypothetical protein ACE5R5_05130 [Nitrosarchaeum sp.]